MLDQSAEREIRVFVSSPSDVGAERARAAEVLKELSAEFAGRFRLVPVLWEQSYYSAHRTFQEAIPKPSSCELVVCILWKRLGTELSPEYNRADGSARTGTEYEFEEALEAALRHELPDIFVYRRRVLIDAERVGQEASELRALNAFWQRWFSDEHGNFSATFDRFDTDDEFAAKLKANLRRWLGRESQQVSWSIERLGSPFRSLEPFDAGHAQVFFGRRRAIRQAVSKLAAAAAKGCAFLLLLGGSGTGKSSLARAGILPFLAQERARPEVAAWRTAAVRPAALGEDLLRGLAEALFASAALPELAQDGDPAHLATLMRTAPADAVEMIAAALQRVPCADNSARLVLLVDQLEELLLRPAEDRRALIGVLHALARGGKVWVVATLRSDRYAELQTAPALVRLKADGETLDLMPPGPAEIREIIEGPARAAGLRFEETAERSLAALLEVAAQERGALPLLQFTLQSLFIARDPGGMLLLSVYDRLGGLAGAIAGEAERLVGSLPGPLRAALPGLLLKLVEIEEGKDAASARTLDRAAVADPAERELASRMIDGRLLTIDGAGAEARLRLAHEALLTRWPLLADLIAEHRDFLAVRRRLEADAAAWQARDRHPDFLLPSGRRLAEAADALAGHRAELDQAAVTLVEASLAAERERQAAEAEARRRDLEQRAEAAELREQVARRLFRRTRAAVAIVSVLLIAMVGVAALWLDQREVAKRRAAEAERNYATALKAASENLGIVERASMHGRMTFPVKQALLRITRDAFANLAVEHESTEATEARARLLMSLEAANDANAADLGRKSVELAAALVAREPANPKWQELLQSAQWELGDRLVIAGDLAEAAKQLASAEAITLKFSEAHPDDADWRSRLAANRKLAAAIMLRRGDLAGALERYRASKDRLGEGDVLLARGEVMAAAEAFRDHLQTVEANAKQAAANANVDAALALAHARMGDVLRVEADPAGARTEYEAAVKLAGALFENKLGSFGAARSLYAASRGTADVDLAKGDAVGALAQYRVIAETAGKRIANASNTPEWQAELAEINERIGDALFAQADVTGAEGQYRMELAAAETVARTVPEDAGWRRDVELAHGRLADALRAKGDLDGAAAENRTRVELAGELAKLDPTEADWQRDLALGWAGLGRVAEARHDAGAAAEMFAHCRAIPLKTGSDPRDELARDPTSICRPAEAP